MKSLFRKIIKKMGDEFLTIPNMLSIFRIFLIPVIVYLYCVKQDNIMTFVVVAFSSLTDIVDGFIARRFNMITDFGKFLDPLADKATQFSIIVCLITKFKIMILPTVVLVVKEIFSLVVRMVVFKRTERVDGARWHGKASTCLIVATIMLHLLWNDIPAAASVGLVLGCTAFMLFSTTLYMIDNFKALKDEQQKA